MKKIKLLFPLFILIFSVFITSCSSDDEGNTEPERTLEDIEADYQALNLTAGTNDVSIDNRGGNPWNFRIIIPESEANSPRPLVLTLHGASGGDADAHKYTDCYAEEGFAAIDPIILSPNGGIDLWDEPFNQDMILGLLYLVNKFQNVDDSKVVVTGYSNGGNGAWKYAETAPGLFSAAIPIASSYNTFNTAGDPRLIDVPLYVIHGEDDELFPVEQTIEWVEATRSAGTDVTLEVVPELTHYNPCDYVDPVKNATKWLQEEVWN